VGSGPLGRRFDWLPAWRPPTVPPGLGRRPGRAGVHATTPKASVGILCQFVFRISSFFIGPCVCLDVLCFNLFYDNCFGTCNLLVTMNHLFVFSQSGPTAARARPQTLRRGRRSVPRPPVAAAPMPQPERPPQATVGGEATADGRRSGRRQRGGRRRPGRDCGCSGRSECFSVPCVKEPTSISH